MGENGRHKEVITRLIRESGATNDPHARTIIAAQLLLGRVNARLGQAKGEAKRYKELAEKDPLTGLQEKKVLYPFLIRFDKNF